MRPEYIFMDLDGTISDPKEGITKAVAHALSYYGIQVENLDTLEKFIGPPLWILFRIFMDFQRNRAGRQSENTGNISAGRAFLRMFCMME